MKKIYERPKMEWTLLENKDVLTYSDNLTDDPFAERTTVES